MFKSANVGNTDRLLRLLIGVALVAAPFLIESEIWASALIRWGVPLVGLVLVATALFRFCPLYRIIGANTCKAD